MFTWLNKQGVSSDRGFTLQFTERFVAEYREGAKKVTLDVESGFDGELQCIILDPKAFVRWDDGEAIDLERQTTLFRNVQEALAFQGLKLVVEAGVPPY
ncbi:MAG: hypothetical protein AB7I68_14960 [Porticoccaceae bacterium]